MAFEIEIENKITLLFIAFAAAVGTVSGVGRLSSWLSPLWMFLLTLFLFYIAYRIVPLVFDLTEEPLEGGKWKILKIGFIPYWFLWLVFSILVYNILIP